jgi:hypothetical protein
LGEVSRKQIRGLGGVSRPRVRKAEAAAFLIPDIADNADFDACLYLKFCKIRLDVVGRGRAGSFEGVFPATTYETAS